jgi:hypothetical protein
MSLLRSFEDFLPFQLQIYRSYGTTITAAAFFAEHNWRLACSFRRLAENIVPTIHTNALVRQNGQMKFAARCRNDTPEARLYLISIAGLRPHAVALTPATFDTTLFS